MIGGNKYLYQAMPSADAEMANKAAAAVQNMQSSLKMEVSEYEARASKTARRVTLQDASTILGIASAEVASKPLVQDNASGVFIRKGRISPQVGSRHLECTRTGCSGSTSTSFTRG